MAQIEIVMNIRDFRGVIYEQLLKEFDNKIFPYDIYNYNLNFKSALNKEIKTLPLGRDSSIEATDINLSFSSNIDAEIDEKYNMILYYENPWNHNNDESGASEPLCSFIDDPFDKYDSLDDDFKCQLDLFCMRMTHTIILTMPWIDINTAHFTIYLNHKKFKNKNYITYPIHQNAYEKWTSLFKTNLNIIQTWNWLNLNHIHDTDNSNCPAVSILSYLLNREYHEIMLYSVIGLEALYGDKKNNHGVSFKLQNRIHSVFPDISQNQIKEIYKDRSVFTHGCFRITSHDLFGDFLNGNFKYENEAIQASAIFLESIRMLIANNAVKMVFHEKTLIDFKFE